MIFILLLKMFIILIFYVVLISVIGAALAELIPKVFRSIKKFFKR